MSTPGSGSKASRRRSAGGGGAGRGDLTPRQPSSRDVGAQSALVFRVVEVDSQDGDFGVTVWMPQASMLSASLSASQLVSVSVCVQSSSDALDTSHVENLEERCSSDFGVAIENSLKEEPGVYRVIASAWPCRKLKEGVRVSKQLACAIGCSQSLPQVYLSPITCSVLNHCKGLKLHSTEAVEVDVQECHELVLRLCPHKLEDSLVDTFNPLHSAKGTPERQPLVSKASEASPSTPASRLPNREIDILRSHVEMSGFSLSRQDASSKVFDKNDVLRRSLRSILGDENSRAFKMVERLAGRILHGRYLLKGNFVAMNVCGQHYILQVVDVKSAVGARSSISDQGTPNESENKRSDLKPIQVPILFLIGSRVQVKLILSVPAAKSASMATNSAGEKMDGVSAEDIGLPLKRLEYSALGGLSEQIATLKEIIKFSLLQPECLLRLAAPSWHTSLWSPWHWENISCSCFCH